MRLPSRIAAHGGEGAVQRWDAPRRSVVVAALLAASSVPGARVAAQATTWQPTRCLADTVTAPGAASAARDSVTSDTVAPGISYSCRRIAAGPWLLHVLAIDLRTARITLDAERATGHMLGRERVSDMAARLTRAGHPPLAAINADFFDLATGEIENNNVVGGRWVKGVVLSDSPHDEFDNPHTQVAIDGRGKVRIGRFRLHGSAATASAREPLVGLNYRPPRTPGLVVYTPWFGERTPAESAATVAADRPVDPDSRPAGAPVDTSRPRSTPSIPQLRADSARRLSLAATREALELRVRLVARRGDTLVYAAARDAAQVGGGTTIPRDGAVLSATGDARDFVRRLVARGGRVRVIARLVDDRVPELARRDSAFTPRAVVGGWPGLVVDGTNVGARADSLEGTFPRFSTARHPRSAIAITRDSSTLLLVVVDGRRPWSVGMSLGELADRLIAMGAWQAMNFDGGGSSTLWIRGSVVNYPSDPSGERAVGNALVVYPASSPSGEARRP